MLTFILITRWKLLNNSSLNEYTIYTGCPEYNVCHWGAGQNETFSLYKQGSANTLNSRYRGSRKSRKKKCRLRKKKKIKRIFFSSSFFRCSFRCFYSISQILISKNNIRCNNPPLKEREKNDSTIKKSIQKSPKYQFS